MKLRPSESRAVRRATETTVVGRFNARLDPRLVMHTPPRRSCPRNVGAGRPSPSTVPPGTTTLKRWRRGEKVAYWIWQRRRIHPFAFSRFFAFPDPVIPKLPSRFLWLSWRACQLSPPATTIRTRFCWALVFGGGFSFLPEPRLCVLARKPTTVLKLV